MKAFRFLLLGVSLCQALFHGSRPGHVHQIRQYSDTNNGDPFSGRHKWIPANQVDGASRTSCPFLNTAANHNYLPRDGRQISIAQFDVSIIDSLNFAPEFAHTITTGMLTKLGVITNDSTVDARLRLDLEQTNVHGKTEHDASISRLDFSQGDNLHVNPELVEEFMRDTLPVAFPLLNTTSVGRTLVRRQQESTRLGNPQLNDVFEASAHGEAALIITIMGDDTGPITADNVDSRMVPKDRTTDWLLNERFPMELGFKKPLRQVQAAENAFIVSSVAKWQSWMEDPSTPSLGPPPQSPPLQSSSSQSPPPQSLTPQGLPSGSGDRGPQSKKGQGRRGRRKGNKSGNQKLKAID